MATGTQSNIVPFPTQVQVPSEFDVRRQAFVLYRTNGTAYEPPTSLCCDANSLTGIVQEYYRFAFQMGVTFAISLTMLINLIALTPYGKRRLPLFILECVSLVLICIRELSRVLVLTNTVFGEPLMSLYWNNSWIKPRDEIPLAIASICPWITLVTVFASLFIQARAILSAVKPKTRGIIMTILLVAFVVCFVSRSWYYYLALRQTLHPDTGADSLRVRIIETWIFFATMALFSGVFAWNVFLTLKARIGMGLRRSDALEVLLIVSLESMVIPFIFALLENMNTNIPDASSIAVPAVAWLLPFGSLWAGATSYRSQLEVPRGSCPQRPTSSALVNNSHTLVNSSDAHVYNNRKFGSASTYRRPSQSQMTETWDGSTAHNSSHVATCAAQGPDNRDSQTQNLTANELDRIYPELSDANAIHVDRDYRVDMASPNPVSKFSAKNWVSDH